MLRIHQVFFLNILGLFIASLLIASLISFYTLKSMVIKDNEQRLLQTINLLIPQITTAHDYDALARSIAEKSDFRVTIIDENGTVIAETNANKRMMENHSGRIEIMASMTQPYGMVVRYSKTLKTDFIYVAQKITLPHKVLYFRLSTGLGGVMHHFYELWFRLLASFVIFIFIALIIAYKISKKTRHDIGQITQYLNAIAEKNYQAIHKPQYFQEFLYLSLLLKNLVKKLRNRDKQKRKYTARLRLINKQQNDILSAISHEFKNPIAAIMGYAETLHDDPKIDAKIRDKFLEKILSNTRKITLMLDRLTLSVKLENNDLSTKPTHFDLGEVCADIVCGLQSKYSNRRILFETFHKTVYADKTMIEMVITNLIDNALKYSEEEVKLKLTENTLNVTDKGIGIAPDDLEKITHKFYRVQKNRWDNSMGLGLSIVSYILRLHGTTLTIHSTLGVGSKFGFSLNTLIESTKKS
ncbi:MAG: ATP-binding protein [Campylobacterales bacterium]|nr:ATP-binding protein [Campylobacterales bacterium]